MTWRSLATDRRSYEPRCSLTLQAFGKEQAHIVPRGETEWFEVNQIGTLYLEDRINDVECFDNKMLLRADLHKGLDDKLFAFVPKEDHVVLHCFDKAAYAYHNTILQHVPKRELLLARFAFTILPICLLPWLKMKKPRMLWVEEDGNLIVKEVSAEECQDIAHRPRITKSTSPKKRRVEESPVSLNISIKMVTNSTDNNFTGPGKKTLGQL